MRNSLLRCGYLVNLYTIHISESVLFFTSVQLQFHIAIHPVCWIAC